MKQDSVPQAQEAREIIEGLYLTPEYKEKLRARLEESAGSVKKLESFMRQLKVLKLCNQRLELQAKVTDFRFNREQLMEVTKKQMMEILQEKKAQQEEKKVDEIREKIQNLSS